MFKYFVVEDKIFLSFSMVLEGKNNLPQIHTQEFNFRRLGLLMTVNIDQALLLLVEERFTFTL